MSGGPPKGIVSSIAQQRFMIRRIQKPIAQVSSSAEKCGLTFAAGRRLATASDCCRNSLQMNYFLLSLALLAVVSVHPTTAAHPECRWACDDPICPADCVPVCEAPNCTVQCTSPAQCLAPSCTIFCPPDQAESDSCPTCTVNCAAPVCDHPACQITCGAPECTWYCTKPVVCRPPTCALQCERPACEGPAPSSGHRCSVSVLLLWVFVRLLPTMSCPYTGA